MLSALQTARTSLKCRVQQSIVCGPAADRQGDNQRDENGYQFNNIGFIDDISIFADTPEGMQKLLNVVKEFTAWCGMQIGVKKTCLLIIDND